MWFLVNFTWQIIYNCWWHLASSANDLVAFVWSYVKLPFVVVIHILKSFGLLSLSVTHLVLRNLYYIFLLWVFVYLLMLLYRFITQRDWAIQLELYMGSTPHHDNLYGGDGRTLTIAPVLLNQHCRQCLSPPHIIELRKIPPKKPLRTFHPSTREKRQATQVSGPAAKTPISWSAAITRTIHQVNDAAGAPNFGSPLALTAHPFRVQHAGSHTPSLGYGLPTANQSPAQWWGPWGPPPPWAQYYQQWPPLAPLGASGHINNSSVQQPVGSSNWQQQMTQANQSLVANYNLQAALQSMTTSSSPEKQKQEEVQQSPDPLVSALVVSAVPGKQAKPILSMHVSQSIKKCIWAGEYIDLAYLLKTNPVPEDDKSYEFAYTSHSTNKLSLTTTKPKAKIESYNAWNKAFRVLTEIFALRDQSQCLPIVQYVAELNDNIGKFTFLVTYQYDIKFYLKKQIKPSWLCWGG